MSSEANPSSAEPSDDQADLVHRVAQLTRNLRESMKELGLDRAIQDAAVAIPDARDRLFYIAQMTEKSANTVLTAAELIRPKLDAAREGGEALSTLWMDREYGDPVSKDLEHSTREYLSGSATDARENIEQLRQIIVAQDFQDLTGQVIKRMMGVIGAIESELIKVLIDHAPQEKRDELSTLLNGPQVKPANQADVVTSQDQVDDLLASLGL